MAIRQHHGHARLTAGLLLIGAIVAGVWVWKRLPLDTQDIIVEEAIPIAALCVGILWGTWFAVIRPIRHRRDRERRRADLLARFAKTRSWNQRRSLAFELVEVNEYRLEGLESVVGSLKEIFSLTLTQAIGDKQHRIRGMAASHLGILQDRSAVPLLVKALDDDHAYVRGCAALGLGRLRATEVKDRLVVVAKDDWDQTVRSRAREAVERMS
ncbi:hypothetical protein YTPLAS18_04320 [Nitrospira sp.]|nr:hypothetical protein YTPLAS18_04320 [Nitrospira sp.]